MKNSLLFMIILFFSVSGVYAQHISEHSLGLRLGGSDGFGAELSYQKLLGRYNRGELNIGWRNTDKYDAFKLSGVYQWIHHLDGNFNWYYGVGGGFGSVDFNAALEREEEDGLFVFAAGQVGVEYAFDFPLLLSFDMRPEVGLIGYSGFDNGFLFDIALGVRYIF